MMKEIIPLTFVLTMIGWNPSFGQSTEYQYFDHSGYFEDGIIKDKRIKKISVTSYWTRPEGEIYQDQKSIYSFNELGDLQCSESYYFSENDPKIVTQQTIDCFEYANGLQSRHLRYHENRDSAEWVREFSYVLDKNKNVAKIIVEDRTHTRNSNIIEKLYDAQYRIISEKTDYGFPTEYRYDSKGNLIEKIWGDVEESRNRNIYAYDDDGNLIKYEFKGTPYDNYDIVKEINKYDNQGRIISKESITAENIKSLTRYSYEGDNIVRSEFLNQKGEVYSTTTKDFSSGLIQSETTVRNGIIFSKEVFKYEFNKN